MKNPFLSKQERENRQALSPYRVQTDEDRRLELKSIVWSCVSLVYLFAAFLLIIDPAYTFSRFLGSVDYVAIPMLTPIGVAFIISSFIDIR